MTKSEMKTTLTGAVALAAILAVTPTAVDAQRAAKAPRGTKVVSTNADGTLGPQAINGVSSGRACLGDAGHKVHEIGLLPQNTRVVVNFVSDFDPIATVSVTQLGVSVADRGRTNFQTSDDEGGNFEPQLDYRTPFPGTAVLQVGKFAPDDSGGCYFFQMQIFTP